MNIEEGSIGLLRIVCGQCGEMYGGELETMTVGDDYSLTGTLREPSYFTHRCS